jgi:hypothetical protein
MGNKSIRAVFSDATWREGIEANEAKAPHKVLLLRFCGRN